ncbi:MAG TPA: hypothetical protein DF364_00875 [Ruminococcaceae bacterium]|nr:hypothetical protein [Oscillospiraceae bacterium]HCU32389.1 hypothetical protein [Oscillospiraceae bacterium]
MSDLSGLLNGLLGSEADGGSEGMDGLFDLLGGLLQSAPAEKKEEGRQEPRKPPDMPDLEQMMKIVSQLRSDDKNIRLLQALQPHLTPERAARADEVIKILRLANLLPLLRFFGGPEEKTGDGEEK